MERERGSTLIEATATLAMVGLSVMMWGSLMGVAPRAWERIDAHRSLVRGAESVLERARAGDVALEDGSVKPSVPLEWPVRITLEVEPAEVPGLWTVTAVARTEVRREPLERRLSTRVWRSP